ncbi:hypothetical protein [Psychromonas ingrahamii]|uniref:hypothetical protein n=1 Tax=Psychromonas ingrahamii TaxID=357794 RepID=UPI0002DD86EE|nr:hypothetical protein [Psychromonas ingrahamii]
MKKKVFVICPGNIVTGGPELLHQFVQALNVSGADAKIIYYPFKKKLAHQNHMKFIM